MLGFLLLVYCLSSVTCSELLSRSRRSWIIESFSIEEEHPGPYPYLLDTIKLDRNYEIKFDIFGQGVDENPKGVLSIDGETGKVYVHKPVDYEKRTMLKLRLEVRKRDLTIDTRLGIEISILDINDNPPLFAMNLYEITIDEDAHQGSHLLTLVAYDKDKRGTLNSTVDYTVKSMSPKTPNTEFFIDSSGVVSFRGCLDYEEAQKFTVVVEAKDRGEFVHLSSSTTVVINVRDKNNHLPVISGQTGFGEVNEDETGTSPLRLHVTDKDSPHSLAWRAKYSIQGDEGGHFKIETDPDTNDGVLTVVKPLDFEEGATRHLSISVENEMPYFSCEVKRRMSTGLWIVDTITGKETGAAQPHSEKVVIEVKDTNDPPVFTVTVKEAVVEENAPIGTWVEKVTAVDPDKSMARDFEYKIGSDPAGWVTIDPVTGNITTVKMPDRESQYVKNGIYTILVIAVDDGEPAMTGTATVNIHVSDQNDNVPTPEDLTLGVCLSDGPTTTNITAHDPDEKPYGGPFVFELLGDVKGKWKLNPSHGYTAGLVRGPDVFAGLHTIQLKISDMQSTFEVYNINVTVCDCSSTPNCLSRRAVATKPGFGAIGVALLSLILFPLALLLAFFISCKKKFTPLQLDHHSGETLLRSNTETPGTDCEIPNNNPAPATDKKHHTPPDWMCQLDGMQNRQVTTKNWEQSTIGNYVSRDYRRENLSYLLWEYWNQTHRNSLSQHYNSAHQTGSRSSTNHHHRRSSSFLSETTFLRLLQRRISSINETEDKLLDYEPHIYADEGDSDSLSELEELIICDDSSYEEALKELGPQFYQLASICMPPQTQD